MYEVVFTVVYVPVAGLPAGTTSTSKKSEPFGFVQLKVAPLMVMFDTVTTRFELQAVVNEFTVEKSEKPHSLAALTRQ